MEKQLGGNVGVTMGSNCCYDGKRVAKKFSMKAKTVFEKKICQPNA